eukprot:TRINITY_DN2401_c0_g1_i3.p2 TRINITY_DN2401_c0_g1~~TRINITY_DN2401_c0_g1_i3.p2  ORF type:complete len:152 (-),score=55.63 TRINITY_DN2401_c0_g1_i3:91-495(-)
MRYTRTSITIDQFQAIVHPFNLPDFVDAFSYSLPFLLEQIVLILQKLVIQMREMGPDMSSDELAADEALRVKCVTLYATSLKSKAKQDALKRAVETYSKSLSKFQATLKADAPNEAAPRRAKKPVLKHTASSFF